MIKFLILILVLFGSSVFAQNEDCAILNFFRTRQMIGSLYDITVEFDGIKVCDLPNGSKMTYKMYSKDKLFINILATFIPFTADLTMKLEKGKSYYIQVGVDKQFQTLFMKQVDNSLGVQQFNDENNFKKNLITFEEDVPKNKNQIVENFDEDINDKKKILDTSPSDVDVNIPENSVVHPYRFALIVGNEDYSSYQRDLKTEANVDFARNDAETFKLYSKKILGIPDDNIIFQINAKAIDMDKNIEKLSLLTKSTGGKAEIFLYYAGHGFPDEITKEAYLIPVDVSGTDLKYAVNLKKLYEKLTQYSSKKVIVFLDACFSGGSRNQGLVASRGVKIKPRESMLNGNLLVFSASSGEQSSLAYKEKKHGLFTYYLLKKLQETKGNISYKELSEFLNEKVSVQSIMINSREQNPQINISPDLQKDWELWKITE